jgi:hypothetical protein
MTSPEAVRLGALLDEDHSPETNGRMPVCRRCGAYTESPMGCQHVPNERRIARAQEWIEAHSKLRGESRSRVIGAARTATSAFRNVPMQCPRPSAPPGL